MAGRWQWRQKAHGQVRLAQCVQRAVSGLVEYDTSFAFRTRCLVAWLGAFAKTFILAGSRTRVTAAETRAWHYYLFAGTPVAGILARRLLPCKGAKG